VNENEGYLLVEKAGLQMALLKIILREDDGDFNRRFLLLLLLIAAHVRFNATIG